MIVAKWKKNSTILQASTYDDPGPLGRCCGSASRPRVSTVGYLARLVVAFPGDGIPENDQARSCTTAFGREEYS